MIEIIPAQSGAALEQVITLSQEYVRYMSEEARQHYPDMDVSELVSGHDYENIRKKFPGEHVPPDGCLLLALNNGNACGCIALGRLTDTICEVRTLFVQPDCRQGGVGKQLVEAVLNQARVLGYAYARLDTLRFMENAQRLYHKLGFYDIEPYLELSENLKSHICFMEMKL